MIAWIKKVNNFQIAIDLQSVVQHLLNFLLISAWRCLCKKKHVPKKSWWKFSYAGLLFFYYHDLKIALRRLLEHLISNSQLLPRSPFLKLSRLMNDPKLSDKCQTLSQN